MDQTYLRRLGRRGVCDQRQQRGAQTVAGWGTAVQGASDSLHFVYAVDGHAWTDQTIGSAWGPPSIARFSGGSGTGWGIAVEGPNHTLDFLWA